MVQPSGCGVARVRTPARSEPAPGSEKPSHQSSSAVGVAAVGDDSGPHQRHADAERGECGCAGAHALLDEQQLLEWARVASAECAWPVEARPPGGMEAVLPPTRERNTRDHVVCT